MSWIRRFGRRVWRATRTAVGFDDSTRRAMHGMRITLVVLTLIVLVATTWSTALLRSTVDEVRTRTAPGLLDVTSARAALVTADRAAVASFDAGAAKWLGPGTEYQNALALANQDLARAAENGVVGVQFLVGLLTAYSGWMSDADAYSRGEDKLLPGAVNLWYASRLLHDDGEGILKHLDDLKASQRAKLDHQLSTGWLNPATALVWVVPALLLLAALIRAQVFLARRFRRRLSPWLVGATAVLIALMVASAPWTQPGGDTRAAAEELYKLVPVAKPPAPGEPMPIEPSEADALKWVSKQCAGAGQCGDTMALLADRRIADEAKPIAPADATRVTARFGQAGDVGWLPVLIPVLGTAVLLFVFLGLRRRINEYGYS